MQVPKELYYADAVTKCARTLAMHSADVDMTLHSTHICIKLTQAPRLDLDSSLEKHTIFILYNRDVSPIHQ